MFYLTIKQERFFSVQCINGHHRFKTKLPQTKTINALLNDKTDMKSRADIYATDIANHIEATLSTKYLN